MIDPAAFARLLCGYCLDVRPDQQVVVRSTTLAAPLLLAVQRELLEREAWPLLRVELPGAAEEWWDAARDRHLDAFAPAELAEAEQTDASLTIHAPDNATALAGVDPARIARAAAARAPVREASMRRRWCGTLWPTPAGAQRAAMGTAEFAAFVRRATFLDRDDPASAWAELRERQARLIERLSSASELRIEADGDRPAAERDRPHVGQLRRQAQHAVGRGLHRAARGLRGGPHPLHDPVEPARRRGRRDRAGVSAGRVVDARAERGGEYLLATLDTDPGARALGEIGIGTNTGIDRPTGAILFDEKIGGTVHLALGRSYPETGGTNESAVHWDMICDLRAGGRLTADGEVIQQDGVFAA